MPDYEDDMRLSWLLAILILTSSCGTSIPISRVNSAPLKRSRVGIPPRGDLCTEDNSDFDGYRYAEQIAHCKRDVPYEIKAQIANESEVDESDWSEYEFDHYIPLNAGGSNSIENLWMEPIADAKEKDKLEDDIYRRLCDGTMTQAEAIALIQNRNPPATTDK